jgi:class 3 adenylate cyclase/tetratricopeptide (TPR) repeat protein
MTFDEVLDRVLEMLQRRGRVSYRALKRQFDLDDAYLEDLKAEIIEVHQLATDQDGTMLVWLGKPGTASTPAEAEGQAPLAYTPPHLTEKILASRAALEGERKQVTVLFADIKGSTELIEGLDPEEARKLLDPALHAMMEAVHRYEGTVNQVLGDGIMALFGAPLAHEDHAVRACYAALAMQAAMRHYAEEVRRSQGIEMQIRVGLNSGEVVVRAIGNDLHMDYSAIGQTTHLAARMEQLAPPDSIRLTAATLRLVEGLVRVNSLGPVPVKGLAEPVEVFELIGASAIRRRLQAATSRGLTRFVGRQTEIDVLGHALAQAGAGHGQVVALVGEPGIGKSRLVYEFVHSHRTRDWLILESASVSYGKATPYFPVIDLLKNYVKIDGRDDTRTIRAKVTGHVLTLDEGFHDIIPALLMLLEALPEDSPFLKLDPLQQRQRILDALKRVLLRESQVQPLLLVFEDLHWIDSETQALLDSLVESLPTARILLLVNYRPEYQHAWGSKTYYTQLRLDALPHESAEELLQTLLGNDGGTPHAAFLQRLKQLLIERTEGNPFFLEESVRTLVETQVLVGERGAYRLAKAISSIQVPATVQAVLAARIDRLPAGEKRLLQTAAVISTEVPFALLQAIAELPLGELGRILEHLREAEALAKALDDPRRLGWISSHMSAYLWQAGDHDRAVESGHRALTFAAALRDVALQVTTNVRLGQAYHALGDHRRALDFFRQNVVSLKGNLIRERFGLPGAASVFSRTWLVWCLAEHGEFAEGIARGEEGVRIAEGVNHPYTLILAYLGIGRLYLYKGDLNMAISVLDHGLALCRARNIPVLFPIVASQLGYACALSGRLIEALPLLEQAVEQAASMRRMNSHSLRGAWLSEAYLLAGRLGDAVPLAQRALELSRDHKERGNEAWALRLLGEIHSHGDPPGVEQAEASYRQALALAEELGMRPLMAHCRLGTLYAKMGRREQARAELSTAIELYRAMEMTFWLPRAEAALAGVAGPGSPESGSG